MSRRVWNFSALFIVALCLYGFFNYEWILCPFPFQLDYREFAQVQCSHVIKMGLNPWAPENAPQDYNCYGWLYPWIAAHVLPSSFDGLIAHRVLSLFFILLASLALGLALRRLSNSRLLAWAGATAYLGCLFCYTTPSARCDALASLCFVLPLAIVALSDSLWALGLAALLAALAFTSKPYAAFSGPLVVLILMAKGQWRSALSFGALWILALVTCLYLVELHYPGIFEETVLIHSNASDLKWHWAFRQGMNFLIFLAWPMLGLIFYLLWKGQLPGRAWAWSVACLATLLVLQLWLGRHTGSYMTYYLQLLEPTLLLAMAAYGRELKEKFPLELAFLAMALLSGVYLLRFPGLFAVDIRPGIEAENLIQHAKMPMLAGDLAFFAAETGKPLFDNGQTQFLALVGQDALSQKIRLEAEKWHQLWVQALANGQVDLYISMTSADQPQKAPKHFRFLKRLLLPAPFEPENNYDKCDVYVPVTKSGI